MSALRFLGMSMLAGVGVALFLVTALGTLGLVHGLLGAGS